MIGVSAAFILSLYGPQFTVRDFCEALPLIRDIGFSAYQPEIYLRTELSGWVHDGREVHRTASDLGLIPSQFVAHFMFEQFASPEQLNPRNGLDQLKQIIDIMEDFPQCRVLTIPALQFAVDWDMPWTITAKGWQEIHQRVSEKVERYVEVVKGAGLRLAFEILPFSVFGGISRFLAICKEIGSPALGLNFDTGHGWACRELLPSIPFELEGRIFGLHLGDNLSTENVKMAPGKGTIPWKPLLESLVNAGYDGSWDIEIGCKSNQVLEEYRYGLTYLQSLKILY
jgi:sugar phosphate isomerase/epimerase